MLSSYITPSLQTSSNLVYVVLAVPVKGTNAQGKLLLCLFIDLVTVHPETKDFPLELSVFSHQHSA
jgi:hypothetical protein